MIQLYTRNKRNLKKIYFFIKKGLTKQKTCSIIFEVLREWRNRQTRTFEGRVSLMYGFKSRFPHQQEGRPNGLPFLSSGNGTVLKQAFELLAKNSSQEFFNARHFPHRVKTRMKILVFIFILRRSLSWIGNGTDLSYRFGLLAKNAYQVFS